MGIFDFLKGSDINKEVKAFQEMNGAILLDVRTQEEYSQGRIPGSINIPLQEIASAEKEIPDKDAPVFVHCYSGVRSGKAVSKLKSMGYSNVKNIGGFSDYKGPIEK